MKQIAFFVLFLACATFYSAEATDFSALYKKKPKQTARLWAEQSGKKVAAQIVSVALSPDAKQVLTGDFRGNVTLWDIDTKKVVWSVAAHSKKQAKVGFLQKGAWAVSTSGDGQMKILDAKNGDEITKLTVAEPAVLMRVDFSPPTSQVFVGMFLSSKAKVLTINADDGAVDDSVDLDFEQGFKLHSIALSPDGQQAAVSGRNKAIRFFNLSEADKPIDLPNPADIAEALAISSKGVLATGHGNADYKIRTWDTSTATATVSKVFGEYTSGVEALKFSPDGEFLFASGGQQQSSLDKFTPVDIWEVSTGKLGQSLKIAALGDARTSLSVSSLALSEDGTRLILGIMDIGDTSAVVPEPTPSLFVLDF